MNFGCNECDRRNRYERPGSFDRRYDDRRFEDRRINDRRFEHGRCREDKCNDFDRRHDRRYDDRRGKGYNW